MVLVSVVSECTAEKSSSLVEGRLLAGLDGIPNASLTFCRGAGMLNGRDRLKDGNTAAKAMAGFDDAAA